MSSAFEDAWASVSPNIDTYFGGAFEIHPRVHVGGQYSDDAARLAMVTLPQGQTYPVITAALSADAKIEEFKGGERGPRQRLEQVAATHLLIDYAKAALPFALKNSDRLVKVATGEVFEVSAPLDDTLTRTQLRVRRISAG